MSKRKQTFDELVEDVNCPDAGLIPMSEEGSKNKSKRETEDVRRRRASKAEDQPSDQSTSGSESKHMEFLSIEDLEILQARGNPPEESADEQMSLLNEPQEESDDKPMSLLDEFFQPNEPTAASLLDQSQEEPAEKPMSLLDEFFQPFKPTATSLLDEPQESADQTMSLLEELFQTNEPATTRRIWPELIEFIGASYRKAEADRDADLVDYNCKNKKLSRRNKTECKGLIRFRMPDEGEAFNADLNDLIEYTSHDDWCEYFGTNNRLRGTSQRTLMAKQQMKPTSSRTDDRPENQPEDLPKDLPEDRPKESSDRVQDTNQPDIQKDEANLTESEKPAVELVVLETDSSTGEDDVEHSNR